MDEDSDSAIFRVDETRHHNKSQVSHDQLALAPPEASSFPIWTAAYSRSDDNLTSDAGHRFRAREVRLRGAKYGEIMQRNPCTISEYMSYDYFLSLEALYKGSCMTGPMPLTRPLKSDLARQKSLFEHGIDEKVPYFHKVFYPDQKSFAVGKVLSRNEDSELSKSSEQPEQEQKQGQMGNLPSSPSGLR